MERTIFGIRLVTQHGIFVATKGQTCLIADARKVTVSVRGKAFGFPNLIGRTLRALRNGRAYVRSCFPQAYAIQTFCCDTGWNRYTYLDICWGRWDLARFERDWYGASDGPCRMSPISFMEFARIRRAQRKERTL
jgi:hypothetical protein